MIKHLLVGSFLIALAPARAHDVQLRDVNTAEPRVGRVSDEVALQRARTAGLVKPRILERKGERIYLRDFNNTSDLEIDGIAGGIALTRKGGPLSRVGIEPRLNVVGPQISEPRLKLSDPIMMRGAVQPEGSF